MKRKWQIVCALMTAGACAGRAALIADWTFETSQPNGNGKTIGGIIAEEGVNASTSIASGYHATAITWTSPAGNGSMHSFNSDHWSVGDYYQFSVNTVGFNQVTVTFDQISSGTGPGKYLFEYSTDGVQFTALGSDYIVKSSSWSSGSHITSTTFTEDLASITALNNNPTVIFRLLDDSTMAAGGDSVGALGTDKVDNFIVNGITTVPEPAAGGLVYAAGALAIAILQLWREERQSFCG